MSTDISSVFGFFRHVIATSVCGLPSVFLLFVVSLTTNIRLSNTSIFENAKFENCYFVSTGISKTRKFPLDCTGITFFHTPPAADTFSDELLQVVEELRSNDIIRRSHTLHLKKGKVNTLSLHILLQSYSEDDLIALLPQVPQYLATQFYTLSYLKNLLKKIA